MEINTEYLVFATILVLLALTLSAMFSHKLGLKSAEKIKVDLGVADAEVSRLTKLHTDQNQELERVTQQKAECDVKIGQLGSEHQSSQGNNQRLQQELTQSKEELQGVRDTAQTSKENQAKLSSALTSTTEIKDDLKQQQQASQSELTQVKTHNSTLQADLSQTKANLESANNECQDKKTELSALKTEHKTLNAEHYKIKQQNAEITTEMSTKQNHFDEQIKLLLENKQELKKEFENMANEILERKGQAFKQLNTESMSSILNPIHQELKGFKTKVEDIHSKESEQRVQLRTELENLQKLNREITEQAGKLTTALKGEKKVQGNWGELMLENVLDNAGLRLGKDYKREVSFNTQEGKLRPDAIIYLPQNKHLVIDAKTSLNAYTRFVNAEVDTEREIALKEHSKAVRDRLNELASKDYCKLPGINSPEVVVMFIPIESAYVAALQADEKLFQLALDNNILIATPTTLLTSLNIVRQLWRFEEQNKHTAELASRAEKFYNKLSTFLTSMQGVGKQLDKAKETYEKAFGQLYTGRGNLIKQAAEFKELGVSVQNELPQELIDKANLELGANTREAIDPPPQDLGASSIEQENADAAELKLTE